MEEKLVGKVSHFFGHPSVGIVELSDVIKVGDTIHIKGRSSDFRQKIASMQIEHTAVTEGKTGDSAGIKLDQKVHENDSVFKVIE